MKKKHLDYALGAFFLIFGTVILLATYFGDMKFWRGNAPGVGFFPYISAICIIICSLSLLIINYIKIKREAVNTDNEIFIFDRTEIRNFIYITGVSIIVMVGTTYVGLIISITTAMFILMKFLGKESWKTSITTTAIAAVVMYLIFSVFLKVPLPTGMLNIL